MRQLKAIPSVLILAFLLAGCTNTGNIRTETPWCTILGTTIVAAGAAVTGGISAIAGGASVGRTLSLPFCHQTNEQKHAASNVIPNTHDKCPDSSNTHSVEGNACSYANPRLNSTSLLKNIYFEFGSAELSAEAHTNLEKVATLLKKHPTIQVRIVGHTDNTGTEKYNLDLSKRRALSVMYCLIQKGVDPKILIPVGRGEFLPVATNKTAVGRQRNRRVVFSYSYQ